jgi:predicted CoA-binding protein
MSERSVAVIGASSDRRKYGNKAVRAFREAGWRVFPVNPNEPAVEGLPTFPTVGDIPTPVDVVTLYVPPKLGTKLLAGFAAKGVQEVWINPGAGNPELLAEADRLGLRHRSLCSIIEVGHSPAEFPDL